MSIRFPIPFPGRAVVVGTGASLRPYRYSGVDDGACLPLFAGVFMCEFFFSRGTGLENGGKKGFKGA